MTKQTVNHTSKLNTISGIAFAVALLLSSSLYFIFYASGISEAVGSGSLPGNGILWLKLHILAYGISSFFYLTGLFLAILYFFKKQPVSFPWIEAGTVVATILVLIGLITGIFYSKPAWNVWWVWDAKHIFSLLNLLALMVIALVVVLTRLSSNPNNRNMALIVLLFLAMAICVESVAVGFLRNVHPQWWLDIFFGIKR